MLSGIFNKVKQILNIGVFIVFIPELLFTLPKNGSRAAVFLNIIFDWKNIKACVMSLFKGGE
jgi:hypothetical protein